MTNNYSFDNPGHQLSLVLRVMFPLTSTDKGNFLWQIDAAIIAEGELVQLVYDSLINYMVRRLINTAEYLWRKNEKSGLPERHFHVELRQFLREEIRVPSSQVEKLLAILYDCLIARHKSLTPTQKNKYKKQAKERGVRCYMCGCELEFEVEGLYDSAEVEHVWPNAMGGPNTDSNIEIACQHCNRAKDMTIEASDFHYEMISLVSDKDDEHYSNEMRRSYEVALWAKSNYKCVECERPAKFLGELELTRRNPRDIWHFMNIDAYCSDHAPK